MKNSSKKVLLIAGGGTLGRYTSAELLRLGHSVDVICLEDMTSDNERLRYIKARATVDMLEGLMKETHYDGVVNFLHYPDPNSYYPYHELLMRETDHLIFLSSYRVYADTKGAPITEDSPQLLDTLWNGDFFRSESYAMSKSVCERYLRGSGGPKKWTIVRPVISFSDLRLDVVLTSGREVIDAAREGRTIVLPLEARDLTAGLDWAGNSGKLIANLLFKDATKGEAYTISSAQGLTWGEVAAIYTELLGVKFAWEKANYPEVGKVWHWYYDRAYDRKVDNSKVLAATGLTRADFLPIREGIKLELQKAGAELIK